MNDIKRTIEYVVEVIRKMPYQFTLSEMGEFTFFLNERLDEILKIHKAESEHTCHTCKHYTSGERDGSCGSYICEGYSDWESEDKE